MSNPNDPWSRRPEAQSPGDQPTEGFGAPIEHSGEPYTADPYQAYGEVPPTQGYPAYGYDPQNQPTEQIGGGSAPTEQFGGGYSQQGYYQQGYGQGYPPPTNPTMAYPTYQQGPYPGELPPLEQQPGGPKRNKTGLIVAGLIVVLLAAIAGVAFLMVGGDSNDSSTQASGGGVTTHAQPPATSARPTPTPTPSPAPPSDAQLPSDMPAIPGLGDALGDAFGNLGVAMGTITKNDGSTLEITDMVGSATTTIRTDGNTDVVTPNGDSVADLKVGDRVVAQGKRNSDGTFQASVLVSMALPDLGGLGGFGR